MKHIYGLLRNEGFCLVIWLGYTMLYPTRGQSVYWLCYCRRVLYGMKPQTRRCLSMLLLILQFPSSNFGPGTDLTLSLCVQLLWITVVGNSPLGKFHWICMIWAGKVLERHKFDRDIKLHTTAIWTKLCYSLEARHGLVLAKNGHCSSARSITAFVFCPSLDIVKHTMCPPSGNRVEGPPHLGPVKR
jgi:hypothetical protein